MGILYLDEAGNTGLWDNDQPNLIYGGPYVTPQNWNNLNNDIVSIQLKYKALIHGKFQASLKPGMDLKSLEKGILFFEEFLIHTVEIVNRKGLWSKLNDAEKFGILDEVVDAMQKNNVTFFAGLINKVGIRPSQKGTEQQMIEYKTLLPRFFEHVQTNLSEHAEITVVIEDGDLPEKEVLKQSLYGLSPNKFMGDVFVENALNYPLLQAADVAVWILQSYYRLKSDRQDSHAEAVRRLYEKLMKSSCILSM